MKHAAQSLWQPPHQAAVSHRPHGTTADELHRSSPGLGSVNSSSGGGRSAATPRPGTVSCTTTVPWVCQHQAAASQRHHGAAGANPAKPRPATPPWLVDEAAPPPPPRVLRQQPGPRHSHHQPDRRTTMSPRHLWPRRSLSKRGDRRRAPRQPRPVTTASQPLEELWAGELGSHQIRPLTTGSGQLAHGSALPDAGTATPATIEGASTFALEREKAQGRKRGRGKGPAAAVLAAARILGDSLKRRRGWQSGEGGATAGPTVFRPSRPWERRGGRGKIYLNLGYPDRELYNVGGSSSHIIDWPVSQNSPKTAPT
jgi:hypothetical protein